MTVDCRWEVIPVFHPELTRPKVMFWISLVVRWGFLLSGLPAARRPPLRPAGHHPAPSNAGTNILDRAAFNRTQVARSSFLLSHPFKLKTGSHFCARCSSPFLIALCTSWSAMHERIGISLGSPGACMPRICPERSWARLGLPSDPGKQKPRQAPGLTGFSMVGVARIELATPAMSTQCSTTELHAHGSCANSGGWGVAQA